MKEIQIVDLLRYYVCWNDTEKVLIEGIQNYDLKAFYNYLVYMKIIRNFKKGSANQILEIAKTFDNKTAEDVCRLSDKLYSKKVLAKNNKNALVASSKILWAFNHDRIIIDSINKKKLKLNTENINECFLRCENPIVLLKGNKTLREFNLRNGTLINID